MGASCYLDVKLQVERNRRLLPEGISVCFNSWVIKILCLHTYTNKKEMIIISIMTVIIHRRNKEEEKQMLYHNGFKLFCFLFLIFRSLDMDCVNKIVEVLVSESI